MAKTLLILAAGGSRRFGRLKQLSPVGPGGEAIMDYTVYDALDAGFDHVVLVVRTGIAEAVRAHVEKGFGRYVEVTYVHQDQKEIAGNRQTQARTKPWGTAHAVLSAQKVISDPFGVANADDLYGAVAIKILGSFLDKPLTSPPTWVLISYSLADTLPSDGHVSRGILGTDNGYLKRIEEVVSIRRHLDGGAWESPEGLQTISGETPVSMNLWGFGPHVFSYIQQRFTRFLDKAPGPEAELFLPDCVGEAVNEGKAKVLVLPGKSPWCGMTSASDEPAVRETISRLVAAGQYPERLWRN